MTTIDSLKLLFTVAALSSACSSTSNEPRNEPEKDAGTDTGTTPIPNDAGAESGAATVTFGLRLSLGETTPAAGARACERNTTNCVTASSDGDVVLPLAANTDHVLELTMSGYRSILYVVHTGTTNVTRSWTLGFFTEAEDATYYAVAGGLDAATGTVTLRAEGTPTLATKGTSDVTFELVTPAGHSLFYANGSATALEGGLTRTTLSGLAGAAKVPPGVIEVRGRAEPGGTCRPFYGGFEVPGAGGDAPLLRFPVVAGFDTRVELRCSL